MSRWQLLLLGLVTTVSPLAAQDTVDELLTAPRVTSFVNFEFSPQTKVVRYRIDADGKGGAELKETLTVVGSDPYPLYLIDYKPLQVAVSASIEAKDDPIFEALGEFVDAVIGLGNTVRGVSDSDQKGGAAESQAMTRSALEEFMEQPESTRAGQSNRRQAIEDAAEQAGDLARIRSQEIFDWFRDYETRPWCIKESRDRRALWEAFKNVDAALFTDHKKTAGETLAAHNDASSAAAVRDAAKALRADAVAIGKAIGDTDREQTVLEALPAGFAVGCASLERLTERTINALRARVTATGAARKKLQVSLGVIATSLDAVAGGYHRDTGDYRFAEVPHEQGKLQEVTITFKPRAVKANGDGVKFSDSDPVTRKLRSRNYQRLVASAAAGVVLPIDLEYPKFGTREVEETDADGMVTKKTIVERVEPDAETVHPALLLNLVFRNGGGAAHWMAQFGVSSGDERPALLFGGGVRIGQPKWLTISGGVIVPFVQELGSLAVGDTVTGTAQIEEDLSIELGDPRLYVALQYSF